MRLLGRDFHTLINNAPFSSLTNMGSHILSIVSRSIDKHSRIGIKKNVDGNCNTKDSCVHIV